MGQPAQKTAQAHAVVGATSVVAARGGVVAVRGGAVDRVHVGPLQHVAWFVGSCNAGPALLPPFPSRPHSPIWTSRLSDRSTSVFSFLSSLYSNVVLLTYQLYGIEAEQKPDCRNGVAQSNTLLRQRQQELKVGTWVTWLYKNQIARQPRQELFRIERSRCYTEPPLCRLQSCSRAGAIRDSIIDYRFKITNFKKSWIGDANFIINSKMNRIQFLSWLNFV